MVALPAVLGLVWLGGWWMVALAIVAAIVGLHEFFTMIRRLRPVVLAGYVGAVLALVGAQAGGPVWMVAGFLVALLLAFLGHGIAPARAPATVAVGSTVLGAGWVGLGLGYVVLLRAIPDHGRLAAFAVLLSVFAADTLAYFAGRLVGRRKLAPSLSPGKTVEGLVAGTAAAVFVSFITLYRTGFVDGWRSIVLGLVIAFSGALGDLFESALKRDMEVKDTGRILAGHGGMLDRLDSILFAAIASFYVIAAFGAA